MFEAVFPPLIFLLTFGVVLRQVQRATDQQGKVEVEVGSAFQRNLSLNKFQSHYDS